MSRGIENLVPHAEIQGYTFKRIFCAHEYPCPLCITSSGNWLVTYEFLFIMIESVGHITEQLPHTFTLSHFFITMIMLLTMILVARTVVAGTKYSSILIIVVFGLLMG